MHASYFPENKFSFVGFNADVNKNYDTRKLWARTLESSKYF